MWYEAFVLSFMILEMATSFSDGSSVRIHFLFPPHQQKEDKGVKLHDFSRAALQSLRVLKTWKVLY